MRKISFLAFVGAIAFITGCSGGSKDTNPMPIGVVTTSPVNSPSASPVPSGAPTSSPTNTPTKSPSPTASPSQAPVLTGGSTPSPASTASPVAGPFTSTCSSSSDYSYGNGVTCNNIYDFGSGNSAAFYINFNGSNITVSPEPTFTVTYYDVNPGAFTYPGTLFAAAQYTLKPSASNITATESTENYLNLEDAALAANSTFYCTIYDNGVELGTSTSTIESGGSTGNLAQCIGWGPNSAPSNYSGAAYVGIGGAVNPGDTFTYIISH
jgi:hypothetical protein